MIDDKEFFNFKNDVLAQLIPHSVSATKNPSEQTEQHLIKIQEKFLRLPEEIQNKLAAREIGLKIQEIGKGYNMQLSQLSDIARVIRSYYFNEIRLEDFPQILAREIPTDLRTAQEISQQVIQKIINDDSQEKAYQAKLIKTSLTDALKGYPEIFEQPVTSVPIRSSNFSEPVRPSIKNWLADYTYNLGYESHDTITRGNYMFQSPNTKTLSFEDRQKLSYILKSYDEKTPVTIDTARKQIVFPAAQQNPKSEILNPKQFQNSNIQNSKQETQYQQRDISRPAFPDMHKDKNIQQPTQALEQNYEHYQIPQKKTEFSSTNQFSHIGSSEFKPQQSPLPSSQNLTFSSPQKLPFERATEKKYSPPAAAPIKPTPPPPAPPKPIMDMPVPPKSAMNIQPVSSKPIYDIPTTPSPNRPTYGPQPLRISPATMLDENHKEETREELPKNVVNLKDNF